MLRFEKEYNMWIYIHDSRRITISPWRTGMGPMTEILIRENEKKKIILEIWEKNFNKEYFSPQDVEKTSRKLEELCKELLTIDISCDESERITTLRPCVQKLMQSESVKAVHAYYGLGLLFGMKKDKSKIKESSAIPARMLEHPGTRLDGPDNIG